MLEILLVILVPSSVLLAAIFFLRDRETTDDFEMFDIDEVVAHDADEDPRRVSEAEWRRSYWG
jgi:hypothetical protein